MTLELGKYDSVQEGLRELLLQANSMQQNLQAQIDTPVLEDGTDLWNPWLNSRTISLYGGLNADHRCVFKIDHEFDLSEIVHAPVFPSGPVVINQSVYQRSEGTEFIIIPIPPSNYLQSYAIQADKYIKAREKLSRSNLNKNCLKKMTSEEALNLLKINSDLVAAAGGFRINSDLTPEEVLNDGWKELVVGKNKASEDDYAKATTLLQNYISKAYEANSFRVNNRAMAFCVGDNITMTEVYSWCIGNPAMRSNAFGGFGLLSKASFLRVRRV